jgi:DNA-binding NtrC family response regulator
MHRSVKVGSSRSVPNPAIWHRELLGSGSLSADQSKQPTVLWIDDFEPALPLYKTMLENMGFKVFTASSGETGLKVAALNHLDLVVTDYEMPGMNGEAVATSVKTLDPGLQVIMFSGSTLVPSRIRRVVDALCDKAGSRDHLLATIHRLLQKKRYRTLQPAPLGKASHHEQRTVA